MSDHPLPATHTARARPRASRRAWIWGASFGLHAVVLGVFAWLASDPPVQPPFTLHASLAAPEDNAPARPLDEVEPLLDPVAESLPPVTIEDSPIAPEEEALVDPETTPTQVNAHERIPLLSSEAFRKPRPAIVVSRPPPVTRTQPAPRRATSGGKLRLVRRPDVKSFYPYEARERNLEGEALVLIEVDRTGRVVRAIVTRSSGIPILDTAAVRFAYANVFSPGTHGRAELPVRFRLTG